MCRGKKGKGEKNRTENSRGLSFENQCKWINKNVYLAFHLLIHQSFWNIYHTHM